MLREKALDILRRESPHGTPLEYHCLRLGEFSMALAHLNAVEMDQDLVFAACYLHDIGLCVKDSSEKNYLKRGLNFVQTDIKDWNLDLQQTKVLEEVMLYSHSVAPVPNISNQADMVRKAVSVEHSLGRITHGFDRKTCNTVFSKYPRKGFNRVLLNFFRIAILEDGPKELFRIFFPEGPVSPAG